jgi:FKBP-type peptidyl-prolyl cis-trans isomerase FkpA
MDFILKKKKYLVLVIVIIVISLVMHLISFDQKTEPEPEPEIDIDITKQNDNIKIAYLFMFRHINEMNTIEDIITKEDIIKGIKIALNDYSNDKNNQLTEKKKKKLFLLLKNKIAQKNVVIAQKNATEQEKYIENLKKTKVSKTKEGVYYEILREGSGSNKPTEKDKVLVHYKGMLIDGTVFDSSYERGEPVTLSVSKIIEGWTIGLQLMTVGSVYKFYIPSNLAYGEAGSPPSIPPNSMLIFEIELLEINPKK